MNEREIGFFKIRGHSHDGVNSTIVDIQPEQIQPKHLSREVSDYIKSISSNVVLASSALNSSGQMAIRQLVFTTPLVAPGNTYTDSINWTGLTIVRAINVEMSVSTECTLTFYHDSTYDAAVKEFQVEEVDDGFLYEGLWAHYDSSSTNKIHYSIENTGASASIFTVTLDASTLSNNALVDYVSAIVTEDGEKSIGDVSFVAGNGFTITAEDNVVTFDAEIPETLVRTQWALTPVAPDSFFTSYGSGISSSSVLTDTLSTSTATYGTGSQWLTADLGGILTIGRVEVFLALATTIHSVKIESSTDALLWTTLKSEGEVWGKSGSPVVIELPVGKNMRYIRVWGNGDTGSSTNKLRAIIPYLISNRV